MGQSVDVSLFRNAVCKQCGICNDVNSPDFCKILFEDNQQKFIESVVIPAKLCRTSNILSLDVLRSFRGFLTLFCDERKCSMGNEKGNCKTLNTKKACYAFFAAQTGIKFDNIPKEKFEADFKWYMDKKNKDVFGISNALRGLSKKKCKSIRKLSSKIISKINRVDTGKIKVKHIKKPTTTSVIINDNVKWIEIVSSILGEDIRDKINNREQVDNRECLQ